MTLKQRDFIANYTDINNPITYSNGTQSVRQAYNYSSDNTAAATASRMLTNNKVKSEIDRVLSELNMGTKVRLKVLNKVLTGSHRQKTMTRTTDKEGHEYTAITVKTPTASDALKAIDLLGKIDGTYDKNKAKADVVSADLKDIMRRHRRELTGTRGGGKGSPA